MNKIRGFEAVSRCFDKFHADGAHGILPQRSTKNSAGYDFYAYEDVTIPPIGSEYIQTTLLAANDFNQIPLINTKPFCIKTGVKAYMQDDEVLQIYPRSSWASKLSLVMSNSVGIIDSDYYDNPDNEGEIGFLVYNISTRPVTIKAGEKLGQGIFIKYLKADNDDVTKERVGGYGSTGR